MYAGVIYQFLVLISLIVFNGYFVFYKGELNDILIGALIGVLASLPFSDTKVEKIDKKE